MAAPTTATGAVYQAILADAGLSVFLGGDTNPRLHIDVAPQGVLRPYVTLQLIQDPSVQHLVGVSDLRQAMVQVDAWCSTAAERDELAALLRARLDGLTVTVADAHIRNVELARAANTREPRNDGSGYTFRWSADARTWYVPR